MRLASITLTTLMFSSLAAYGQTSDRTLYFSATLQSGQTVQGSFGIPSDVESVLGFFGDSAAEYTISGEPGPIDGMAQGKSYQHGAGAVEIFTNNNLNDIIFDLVDNAYPGISIPLTTPLPICSLSYACAIFPDIPVFSTFINEQGQQVDIISGSFSSTAPTPEPSSIALMATGVLGLAGVIRRRSV